MEDLLLCHSIKSCFHENRRSSLSYNNMPDIVFPSAKAIFTEYKKVNYHGRITMIWCSMIFFTSFPSKSLLCINQANMVINCCNIISECIGMTNVMMCDKSCSPRYMMTESVEHDFGGWMSEKREVTVLECNKLKTN